MALAIIDHPSPNHGERRAPPERIDILLLHYTGMPSCQAAIDWLANPASQVSAHYVVREDGTVVRMVDEARRAWHAGVSRWEGETDINSRSIGIEICHPGADAPGLPYPDGQIAAVVELSREILGRHPIPPERVLAHSDVAPARKSDPGAWFPWPLLAAEGVGHWVSPAPITGGSVFQMGDRGQPVEALQAMLALYGYGVAVTGEFEETTRDVVAAFQRHFRPALVDGVADRSTISTLHRLLDALGPKIA
jgi:N-acetylmuramoyl-L-alanine amidase